MITQKESPRTRVLYSDSLRASGEDSSVVAVYGRPGETLRLVGVYSKGENISEVHRNPNVFVADLATALHMFHFQPMGAQSQ